MEKRKQKLGVTFIHLKDKWAYGSTTDSRMTKFVYDDVQISALKSFWMMVFLKECLHLLIMKIMKIS